MSLSFFANTITGRQSKTGMMQTTRSVHAVTRPGSVPARAILVCYLTVIATYCAAFAKMEAMRRLLNNEMNHRIKNILANVQAILNQTLHDQKDIRDKTIARITSLAATNDVLVKADWSGASLRGILRMSSRPMIFRDFT